MDRYYYSAKAVENLKRTAIALSISVFSSLLLPFIKTYGGCNIIGYKALVVPGNWLFLILPTIILLLLGSYFIKGEVEARTIFDKELPKFNQFLPICCLAIYTIAIFFAEKEYINSFIEHRDQTFITMLSNKVCGTPKGYSWGAYVFYISFAYANYTIYKMNEMTKKICELNNKEAE